MNDQQGQRGPPQAGKRITFAEGPARVDPLEQCYSEKRCAGQHEHERRQGRIKVRHQRKGPVPPPADHERVTAAVDEPEGEPRGNQRCPGNEYHPPLFGAQPFPGPEAGAEHAQPGEHREVSLEKRDAENAAPEGDIAHARVAHHEGRREPGLRRDGHREGRDRQRGEMCRAKLYEKRREHQAEANKMKHVPRCGAEPVRSGNVEKIPGGDDYHPSLHEGPAARRVFFDEEKRPDSG